MNSGSVLAGTDPVGVGDTQTLAHPGGNVTGFASFELPVLTKSLEMLKQIAPAITRVAMIYNPDNPRAAFYRRTSEAASRPLAIEPVDAPVHGLADIDRAVTQLADSQNGGFFSSPTSRLVCCATKLSPSSPSVACRPCTPIPFS